MTSTKPTNSNVIIFAYDIYIYRCRMEEDRSGSCDEYNTCNAHKEEFKITIVNK